MARERAGHFIRLINGPFVLPLETAGVCWMRILVSIRSLTRGKPSDYSISNDDINSLPQRLFSLALSDQYRKLSSFIMRAQRCTNMRSRIYRRLPCQYRQHLGALARTRHLFNIGRSSRFHIHLQPPSHSLYQLNQCLFLSFIISVKPCRYTRHYSLPRPRRRLFLNHYIILKATVFHTGFLFHIAFTYTPFLFNILAISK